MVAVTVVCLWRQRPRKGVLAAPSVCDCSVMCVDMTEDVIDNEFDNEFDTA